MCLEGTFALFFSHPWRRHHFQAGTRFYNGSSPEHLHTVFNLFPIFFYLVGLSANPRLRFPALTSHTCADMNKNFNRVVFHSINVIKNSSSQHMWLLGTDFTDLQKKFETVLHRLKLKLLKISPGWCFIDNTR